MKYRFNQFSKFACFLLDWIKDRVNPLTKEETIEAIKECPVSVQKMHLERCLTLEYRVTPRH